MLALYGVSPSLCPSWGKFLDHVSMWQVPRSLLSRAYGLANLLWRVTWALLCGAAARRERGRCFSSSELVDCQRVTWVLVPRAGAADWWCEGHWSALWWVPWSSGAATHELGSWNQQLASLSWDLLHVDCSTAAFPLKLESFIEITK